MPPIVATDYHIMFGTVDVSEHFTSLSLEPTADAPEATAFGGDGWRERVGGGLKDWAVSADFNQDFAASALDATLWPLLGTSVLLEVRATSAARSPTNPSYVGNAILTSYPPFGNSVGDLATGSISFEAAGQLQRLTT